MDSVHEKFKALADDGGVFNCWAVTKHFRICFSSVLATLNGMSQKRHLKAALTDMPPPPADPPLPPGLRPCVFIWRVSLLDCAQLYGHSSHLYGFSPVCDRRWTVKFEQFLNTLPQNSQVSFRPPEIISLRASGSKRASSRPFWASALMALGSIGGSWTPGGNGGNGMSLREERRPPRPRPLAGFSEKFR